MKRDTLTVRRRDGSTYPVVFDSLDYLSYALAGVGVRPSRAVLVTDLHVMEHWGERVEALLAWAGFDVHTEAIPAGEHSKSSGTLDGLYDVLLERGIERTTPLFALGGGVVGDLAGFAAATLLRGVPLVHIPTTVVAQVDSSIGGKTGINHAQGKNLIGAFYAPRLVFTDPSLTLTLPRREWTSGLAEVVKHALIRDAAFFDWLEEHLDAVLARTPFIVAPMMQRAASVKVEVVSGDELEGGTRMLLNFGHTFGHAIERVAGYGTFTHGEAVALGMRAAVHLSHALRPMPDAERALRLLERLPLPDARRPMPADALVDAMRSDKKVRDGAIRFVLLHAIGEAYVQGSVPVEAVVDALRAGLGAHVAG